jgi:hypothetical protein
MKLSYCTQKSTQKWIKDESFFFSFSCGTQGFVLAKQALYPSPVHFALVILKIGFRELFARDGLDSPFLSLPNS